MRSRELADALEGLNPRMRLVIARAFGLDGQPPRTLEQVGPSWASRASACASSSRARSGSSAPRHRSSTCRSVATRR